MTTSVSRWLALSVVVLGGYALAIGGCSSPERNTGGAGGGEAGTIWHPRRGLERQRRRRDGSPGAAGSNATGAAGSNSTGAAGSTGAGGTTTSGTTNTLPATFNYPLRHVGPGLGAQQVR